MENDQLKYYEIVEKEFSVSDVAYGPNETNPYIAKFIGKLKNPDSEKAYSALEAALKPLKLLPIFRVEGEQQIVFLVPEVAKPKKTNPRLNLILFILTLISVLFTGGLYSMDSALPQDTWQAILAILKNGWPFAVSLLAILGTHEFGHYFAGKKNGVDVTLPYFIPFPFNTFGTMGAFINMRSIPKNKKQLFDIAVAGPLSGLVVSIIVLLIGLHLSTVEPLPLVLPAGSGLQMEGNSLLYLLLKYISFGKLLPEPVGKSGIVLLIHWFKYFFTGSPIPLGGLDVMLHPVAWAGWAGLFVTMLNLIPVGQLDGGHIFQALFGTKNSRRILPFIIAGLVLLGFFWNVWWFWAALAFLMGRTYAEPLDQITQLDGKRKLVGILMILVFIMTFIPVPITVIYG
ncbi:MAG: site-2 protease family protein [Anaerolineaceae bacterium]|jgi:membrane-associated protease RseP (regulator of RpoE activity)|nr:MAG: site-2 protease family protein [Anaerolineaceae bacterium]